MPNYDCFVFCAQSGSVCLKINFFVRHASRKMRTFSWYSRLFHANLGIWPFEGKVDVSISVLTVMKEQLAQI